MSQRAARKLRNDHHADHVEVDFRAVAGDDVAKVLACDCAADRLPLPGRGGAAIPAGGGENGFGS